MSTTGFEMSSPRPADLPLALSHQKSQIFREYTASPVYHHARTPDSSHGSMPLGTATPLPTTAVETSPASTFDYFSLSKKEVIISPGATSNKSRGSTPLCSVVDKEKAEGTSDYLSHSLNHKDTRTSTSTSSTSKQNSSPLSPRSGNITTPYHLSIYQLLHPTGSPVHSCDIFALREGMHHIYPSMRGGAIDDPAEQAIEAERSRCSLTGYPMNDSVETLDLNEEFVEDKLSSLEHAVAVHDTEDEAILESSRSDSENACKVVTDPVPDTWGEEWLQTAKALELPVSEVSDEDGNEDFPVQNQRETGEMSPRTSSICEPVAIQRPAAPVVEVVGDQRPIRSSSLQFATLIPELLSEAPATKPLAQTIPPANLLSIPRPQGRPRLDKRRASSIPSGLTILKTAMHTSPKHLGSLLVGPGVSITSKSTGEIYVSSVSLPMLTHFCLPTTLSILLSPDASTICLPTDASLKSGLSRVLRFMTRCCLPHSYSSSSELPIPTGDLSAGIETVLACQVLGLHADASRLTSLIISTQLTGTLSSTLIDDLWNGSAGALRSTGFGDAVVWFMLRESWKNEDGRAEEVMWMLEQDEYSELKERVRAEVGLRLWRKERKDEFLRRWEGEREKREKKRAKKEVVERERVRRVEEIRRRNVEMRERGSDGRSRDEATAKASKVLDIRKALPKTPTTPRVGFGDEMDAASNEGDERDTTAAMYAEYARSFRTASDQALPRDHGSQRDGERIVASRPVATMRHGAQISSATWGSPRAVPVPRRKLSLWEKLKI